MGSSNGRFLLGLLLGLLCGGGLVHLLAGPAPVGAASFEELTPVGPAAKGSATSKASIERGLPTSAPTSERQHARPVPASALRAAQVTDGEVAQLVAGLGDLDVDAKGGTGAIHGRVTDGDGRGLAQVVVRLTSASRPSNATPSSSVGAEAPELESHEETVREAALRHKETQGSLREATTDAAGAYRFDKLADRDWSLRAYLAGYRLTPDVSASRVKVGTEVDFSAEPVVEVPVQVVELDGAAASSAVLSADRKGQDGRGARYAWSPEEAFVRLVPGKYELTAYSSESRSTSDAERNSEAQEITIEAGATPAALRFELRGRLGIRGTVKLAKGDLKSDYLMLRCMPLGPQQEVDLEALANADRQEWAQPGSEYTIADLEPGRYVVGAARSWSSPIAVHQVVEVTTGMVRCDLELPPVDLSRVLRIVVLDASGETLDDVRFSLSVKRKGGSHSSGENPMRDDDGAYLLAFESEEASAYFDDADTSATFKLTLNHEEHGRREVELVRGQTELSVTFSVPGTLEVTVAGYVGSGYEGRLQVSAAKKGNDTRMHFFGFGGEDGLSPEGVQELTGLEPGLHTVTLNARAKGSSSRSYSTTTIDSVEVEILPGANAVQLRIPVLYSLRVHWADGKEGANMAMRLEDGEDNFGFGSNSASLDAQGYAEFSELRAGNYLLSSWGGSVQQMRVTIPCKDVEFTPMKIDAMRVKITDETGDLFRLGFRDGDLVIGVDGEEFEESPDYQLLRTLQSSKSAQATFLIERNGTRLEITAKGADVGNWSDMGGKLVPTQR